MPMSAHSRFDAALLACYLAMVAASLAAVSIAPPAVGAMLLIPLKIDARPVPSATMRGAAILGTGPGRTTIVRGERARLFWPLLRAGVLTIAAPAALCGTGGAA
jgi:hypothetical protein